MTVDIWVLAVLGALWFVTVCYIAHLKGRYTELEMQMMHFKETRDKICEDQVKLHQQIESLENDIEKTKGSVQLCVSGTGKRLSEIQRKHDDFQRYITDHLREIYNTIGTPAEVVMIQDKPNVSAVEYCVGKETIADIVDPVNLEPPEEKEEKQEIKTPTYRWIFPDEEPDYKDRLVFGQWYTVIGLLKSKVKSDGSPMIVTMEGFWNRNHFITVEDEEFDTVYAYILMPSSADIMEKVVQMALHAG